MQSWWYSHFKLCGGNVTTLLKKLESWWYNHYIWCGGNVTTLFKKLSHGGTTITSDVEDMLLPNSRN